MTSVPGASRGRPAHDRIGKELGVPTAVVAGVVVLLAGGDIGQHGGGCRWADGQKCPPERPAIELRRLEPLRRRVIGRQRHAARAVGSGDDQGRAVGRGGQDADARQGLGGEGQCADRTRAGNRDGARTCRPDSRRQQAAVEGRTEAAGVHAAADDEVPAPRHPAAQGVRLGLGERVEGGVAAEQESIHAAIAGGLVREVRPRCLGDLHGHGLTAGVGTPCLGPRPPDAPGRSAGHSAGRTRRGRRPARPERGRCH